MTPELDESTWDGMGKLKDLCRPDRDSVAQAIAASALVIIPQLARIAMALERIAGGYAVTHIIPKEMP